MYSDIIQEHFEHPRNVGALDHPDAESLVSNPACGDTMHLYLRIVEQRIVEATYQTMGCPAAIAAGSITTELLHQCSLAEALQVTRTDIEAALGGLTPQKKHTAVLAEDAIKAAVRKYQRSQAH